MNGSDLPGEPHGVRADDQPLGGEAAVVGDGNQALHHVSAGGDVVLGDKVEGDQVAGDKVAGDKVVIEHVDRLVLQGPTGATAWIWPRPWDFSGYIQDKRRHFTGRGWLFDQVRVWHADPTARQALLIVADFGVGKSAFMAELCATEDARWELPIVAHHFCDHNTAATLEPATFVRSLAAQLALALPAYKAAVESDPAAQEWLNQAERDPASAFSQAVTSKLAGIEAPATTQVLLVDGLDETIGGVPSRADGTGGSIVALLANATGWLPGWLRVLATSRRRQEVRQPLRQAYRCQKLDAEQAANLDDIRDYTKARCRTEPLAGKLAGASKTPNSVAGLLREKCGGKFLYAVRVLNDLAGGALEADRLEDLPPGMDGFYLDAFQRRFPSADAYATMRPLLGLLGEAREPMDRATLGAVLGMEVTQVQQALRRIEDFLRITPKGRGPAGITGPTYAFDHISLSQWLTEEDDEGFARAGDFALESGAARELISVWAVVEGEHSQAHRWPYLARHLDRHLDEAQRRQLIPRLLMDLNWLRARLEMAGLPVLLKDWEGLPLTASMQGLRRSLYQSAVVICHEGTDWYGLDQLPCQLLSRWPPFIDIDNIGDPERCLRRQAEATIQQSGGLYPIVASLHREALLRILLGHKDAVKCLALLHDGRLASGSSEGTILLWDEVGGVPTATLQGHCSWVNALAVLLDGRLASGSADGTIKLWDPATGDCVATIRGHSKPIVALAVLPDGRLASGSADGTIKLWDPATGEFDATFHAHIEGVNALAVLPGGRLASSTWGTIKLWDLATGDCVATIHSYVDMVWSLAVLPDGRLASGMEEFDDHTIKLWDPATGECVATLRGHSNPVVALAVLPNGFLASGSRDGTIWLWDPTSGSCAGTLEGHTNWINAFAVFPDGRLASGSDDRTILLWDPAISSRTANLEKHTLQVNDLEVLPNGLLASGADDQIIRLWDPVSGACTATIRGHIGSVTALAVIPDGRLASGERELNHILLWDLDSRRYTLAQGDDYNWVSSLAVLPDGRLASGGGKGSILLWDLANGPKPGTRNFYAATRIRTSRWVSALAVLHDGRLASGEREDDGTILLWDTASGACATTLKGHPDPVRALAVLPSGRLASGSWRTIKLWDPTSGSCAGTLEGHTNWINAFAVFPDGRLASGSDDQTIRLWHLDGEDPGLGQVIFVADAAITALVFIPEASILAAGDANGRLHWLRLLGPSSSSDGWRDTQSTG